MGGRNIFDDSGRAKNIRAPGTGPGRIAALAGPRGLQKPLKCKTCPIRGAAKLAGRSKCMGKTGKVKSRFRFECMLVRTPSTVSET